MCCFVYMMNMRILEISQKCKAFLKQDLLPCCDICVRELEYYYYYYYYYYVLTLFSRLLMLTLILLGIIINFLPWYRLSYFVFCSFNYFCVFLCTRALYLASVLLSLHVNKHELLLLLSSSSSSSSSSLLQLQGDMYFIASTISYKVLFTYDLDKISVTTETDIYTVYTPGRRWTCPPVRAHYPPMFQMLKMFFFRTVLYILYIISTSYITNVDVHIYKPSMFKSFS
jgi:hypothetical protein